MEKRMYKIDFATNTVKITKAFEKQAQVFGSEAYTYAGHHKEDIDPEEEFLEGRTQI